MPKLNDPNMEIINTASNYGFSATKLDQLGASEYSLCTCVTDKSGSLSGSERDLEKMLSAVVQSCRKSPRAENLMFRVTLFSDSELEVHGFKLLETIKNDDYNSTIFCGGSTLLFDSVYRAIESTNEYAKVLARQDYLVNGLIVAITDGMDNASKFGPNDIKNLLEKVRKDENLESLIVILIGMCADPQSKTYLDDFKTQADLTDYIEVGNVTPGKIGKIAGFVSHSISSTSQALGTGGPSKAISKLIV